MEKDSLYIMNKGTSMIKVKCKIEIIFYVCELYIFIFYLLVMYFKPYY